MSMLIKSCYYEISQIFIKLKVNKLLTKKLRVFKLILLPAFIIILVYKQNPLKKWKKITCST